MNNDCACYDNGNDGLEKHDAWPAGEKQRKAPIPLHINRHRHDSGRQFEQEEGSKKE